MQLSRWGFCIADVALVEVVLAFVVVDCGLLFQSLILVIPTEFSSTKKENFGGGGEGDDNVGISNLPFGINNCGRSCFDSDEEE